MGIWDWRDEQEEAARDAAIVRRHARDFRSRLRDSMARGDHVWLGSGDVRVAGFVIEVADDLVSLRAGDGRRVDVRLGAVPDVFFGVVEAAAGPGCTPPLSSGGWRGRMLAAEVIGERYSVVVRGVADALEGRIAVGLDHLDVVNDSGTVVTVPFPMVVCVSSSRRSALR